MSCFPSVDPQALARKHPVQFTLKQSDWFCVARLSQIFCEVEVKRAAFRSSAFCGLQHRSDVACPLQSRPCSPRGAASLSPFLPLKYLHSQQLGR